MHTAPQDPAGSAGRTANRFAWLAFITAACTYGLIVFGGVVRITGSGMGCGDDWPLCNGRLIPPLDFQTLIEYGHRLAALLVSALVLAVALYSVRFRRSFGDAGRGVFGLAMASLALLVIQVMVGAITVWLELPAATVVLHLMVASTLLASLIVAGMLARAEADRKLPAQSSGASYPRWAVSSAGLGFALLFLGGLVANTGAGPWCQGFPLCSGQLFPEGPGLVHLHWTHRLLAYATLIVVAVAAARTMRQKAPTPVTRAALVALVLIVTQIVVAATLVLRQLPADLRAIHLAVGVALWAALVVWATLALRQGGLGTAGNAARDPA